MNETDIKHLCFVVDGAPQGKARPRFTRQGKTYTPLKTKNYEQHIAHRALQAMYGTESLPEWERETEKPIFIAIEAVFPIPKSYTKTKRQACLNGEQLPTVKPDVDNIVKVVGDALNDIAYKDDKQVVGCFVIKRYNQENEDPCINVSIGEIKATWLQKIFFTFKHKFLGW
ncbi:MAG: RusA family crossover junction endodeoxyribonuclease [Neisseriaceae bacterium]|nr:RusA family crossover junction endodeoxyribonuclease [Neisseriaceae bacterium]